MNWQKGTPQMGEHRASAKIMELEARIAKLEKALKIQPNGDIELSSTGTLKISATQIQITGHMNLEIKSGASVEIKGMTLEIKGAAVTSIQGSIVKLNNGGKPVACVGSTTAGSPASQTIVTGSPTVLIP